MTEDPLTTCPDCSGSVKKLMSAGSFQLKGGGWYADGYSSKACNSSSTSATDTAAGKPAEKVETAAASSPDSSTASKTKEGNTAAT